MGIITAEVFEAFLRCPTKAQLYLCGATGVPNALCEWERQHRERFKNTVAEWLLQSALERERHIGTPSAEELQGQCYRVILDYTAADEGTIAHLDALVLDTNRPRGTHPYLPVRFVAGDKITRIDKLLVAFDALALSRSSGMMPRVGKIIHGSNGATISIKLPRLIAEVRRIIQRIGALTSSTPDVILNPHCQECAFEGQCRTTAVAKDDLSLLPRMTAMERSKLH